MLPFPLSDLLPDYKFPVLENGFRFSDLTFHSLNVLDLRQVCWESDNSLDQGNYYWRSMDASGKCLHGILLLQVYLGTQGDMLLGLECCFDFYSLLYSMCQIGCLP